MNFVVESEANLYSGYLDNGWLGNELKKRSSLFEFILDILSNPRLSSILSWRGTNGQFVIIDRDKVAQLWGERNGRRNMTYEKFSRAMRYYYHKKVLIKIRGRKYTYKFNFRELERQYGYRGISFPATYESGYNYADYEIFATGSSIVMSQEGEDGRPFGSSSHFQFNSPFFFEF